jgi:hypothetical protein
MRFPQQQPQNITQNASSFPQPLNQTNHYKTPKNWKNYKG